METLPKDVGHDFDLDALMIRVREAAMTSGTHLTPPAQTAGGPPDCDVDVMRVIEAQGEWNEHTRKSLVALVECLRALRDDWTDAQARLRQDVEQLSALVDDIRAINKTVTAPAKQAAAASKRRRRASAAARGASTRQAINGGKRRS